MGKRAATPGDTNTQSHWSTLSRWRKIETWILGGFFTAGMVFMVSYPWVESQQEWVQCEVVEASSAIGRTHPHLVSIQTTDCDKLAYAVGINKSNVEDIAATFEPGEYEFLIGGWSRFTMQYDIFPGATGVNDFRKVADQ